MKRLTIFSLLLCGLVLSSFGQETISTKTFDASKAERLDLRFKYPELIKVKTWDKSEVQIISDVFINDGRNNDDFNLESKMRNGVLNIDSEIKNLSGYRNYTIDRRGDNRNGGLSVSRNGTTITRNGKWSKNSVIVSVILEITVPAGMEVNLNATYGIVEVLSTDIPLEVDSRYGGIDVMVDEKSDLDIQASTQWGQIYHNLDAKLRAKGDGYPGKWMRTEASLNKGTRKLIVESQYGNVYLRKGN